MHMLPNGFLSETRSVLRSHPYHGRADDFVVESIPFLQSLNHFSALEIGIFFRGNRIVEIRIEVLTFRLDFDDIIFI